MQGVSWDVVSMTPAPDPRDARIAQLLTQHELQRKALAEATDLNRMIETRLNELTGVKQSAMLNLALLKERGK